jgi:hypothetical protein
MKKLHGMTWVASLYDVARSMVCLTLYKRVTLRSRRNQPTTTSLSRCWAQCSKEGQVSERRLAHRPASTIPVSRNQATGCREPLRHVRRKLWNEARLALSLYREI